MTAPLPLPDGESGWSTFAGTVRVRSHPLGSIQLQVSTPHGDGTNDVATFLLAGSLRDVRNVATTFPTYGAPSVPEYATDADRRAAEVLTEQAKGHITSSSPVPVSGGTPNK